MHVCGITHPAPSFTEHIDNDLNPNWRAEQLKQQTLGLESDDRFVAYEAFRMAGSLTSRACIYILYTYIYIYIYIFKE